MDQTQSPHVHWPPYVPDPHGVNIATVFIDGNTYGQHGKLVDTLTVRRCIRAAIDRCTLCQDHYLDRLAADPLALTYLIDCACAEVGFALARGAAWKGTGQLPPSMTDPAAAGVSSADFRLVARHWRHCEPDSQPAMYAAVDALDDVARQQVARDALGMLLSVTVKTGADA